MRVSAVWNRFFFRFLAFHLEVHYMCVAPLAQQHMRNECLYDVWTFFCCSCVFMLLFLFLPLPLCALVGVRSQSESIYKLKSQFPYTLSNINKRLNHSQKEKPTTQMRASHNFLSHSHVSFSLYFSCVFHRNHQSVCVCVSRCACIARCVCLRTLWELLCTRLIFDFWCFFFAAVCLRDLFFHSHKLCFLNCARCVCVCVYCLLPFLEFLSHILSPLAWHRVHLFVGLVCVFLYLCWMCVAWRVVPIQFFLGFILPTHSHRNPIVLFTSCSVGMLFFFYSFLLFSHIWPPLHMCAL